MKKLPVITSSAVSTSFVVERLDGPADTEDHLWIDGNQKVTAGNGSYAEPRANSLSLVQIDDCPNSTPTCRASCYVHGLEAAQRDLHDKYRHNSETIRRLMTVDDERGISAHTQAMYWWAKRLGEWISENAAGGFRWHVSGDLFHPSYAEWISWVVRYSPSVRHWIYTRSHAYTAAFVDNGCTNLTINLSADRDNYASAIAHHAAHAGTGTPARIAYMVTGDGHVPADLPPGSVIFPDYALRGARGGSKAEQRASSAWWQSLTGEQRRMVCGVDFYGKSEKMRCGPCRKCIDPVQSKKESA